MQRGPSAGGGRNTGLKLDQARQLEQLQRDDAQLRRAVAEPTINSLLEVGTSCPRERVVACWGGGVTSRHGAPASIIADNRLKFSGKAMDDLATTHWVQLQLIRPGKPVENVTNERFNGVFETSVSM